MMKLSDEPRGDAPTIDIAALRLGMYVHLDRSWLEHPFPKSSFKIKTDDQIATIRSLGLQRVRWSPALSDTLQPASQSNDTATASDTTEPRPSPDAAASATPSMALPAATQQQAIHQCQKALADAVRKVKGLSKTLHSQPSETREAGRAMVQQLVTEMMVDADLAMRLMADQAGGESLYHHALNVTLLSLMLARALKAPKPVIELIGLGALFHDIGKFEIPDRITRATQPLNRAETALLETHTTQGVTLAQKLGLSAEVVQIIAQHHEMADGSGYPKKLKGNDISLPTRIVAVVNAYDNLCNALNPQTTMTPHEALALLYGRRRSQFDEKVLSAFVRCMGVYPPGTMVRLSNERLGVVVAVNSTQPLKPTLMLFDPTVKREAAPLLDLEDEPDLAIIKSLRPQELPEMTRSYLSLGTRTTYYFSAEGARR
jgi:putative nucleotidyltransferase with HDIG domain